MVESLLVDDPLRLVEALPSLELLPLLELSSPSLRLACDLVIGIFVRWWFVDVDVLAGFPFFFVCWMFAGVDVLDNFPFFLVC